MTRNLLAALDATRAELAEVRSMADGAYGLNREVRRALRAGDSEGVLDVAARVMEELRLLRAQTPDLQALTEVYEQRVAQANDYAAQLEQRLDDRLVECRSLRQRAKTAASKAEYLEAELHDARKEAAAETARAAHYLAERDAHARDLALLAEVRGHRLASFYASDLEDKGRTYRDGAPGQVNDEFCALLVRLLRGEGS